MCSFGSGDVIPSTTKAESFVAFRLMDKDNRELEITQFNQDDYTKNKKEAGYICEKETLWGCPEGYFMNYGSCIKLFRTDMDWMDAETFCKEEENAKLVMPKTYVESEFIESLITHLDSQPEVTMASEKIWLGYRRDMPDDDTFFDFVGGHTDGTLSSEDGDCMVMSIDSGGVHHGWHRESCSSQAFVMCQKGKWQNPVSVS